MILLWGYNVYVDYQRKYYFTDIDRLERITGVRFPEMNVVEFHKGYSRLLGDYNDEVVVVFKDSLSDTFYFSLDSIIKVGNTNWNMNRDTYVFSQTWGNGMPAPTGESDEEDRMFCISFDKRSNKAVIHSGMW